MSVPHVAPSGHLCSTPHHCWCTTRRKQTGNPPLLGLCTPRDQPVPQTASLPSGQHKLTQRDSGTQQERNFIL